MFTKIVAKKREYYSAQIGIRIPDVPLLTATEEQQLSYIIQRQIPPELESNDRQALLIQQEQAIQKLVTHNLRLIFSVIHKYFYSHDIGTLFSAGYEGLKRAAELYDGTKARFNTYAVWWIRQSISRSIQEESLLVHLPVYQQDNMEKIKRHITTLEKQYGRKPTVFEISAASFFSPEKVREILLIEQTYIQPVSLNRKINAADDDSAETIDLVASTIPSPHEIIAEKAQNKYLYSLLRKYLLPMDFIVIYYRFGLNGDQSLTLEEIAKKYGITRERVRQREARALKRLAKIPAIQDIFTQETNKSISDQTEVKKTSRSRSAGKVHSKKTARLSTEQLDSTLLDAEEEYA